MISKHVALILLVLTVSNAAAPAWVDQGVNLTYTAGSSTLNFYILSRNSTDVKTQITQGSSHYTSTENASGDYGQIWFDSTLLGGVIGGDAVSDFTVSDVSTQSFAGKDWNTVTLQRQIGDSTETRILDQQTGLLLKQSVNAPGAPQVILIQYTIPSLAAPPPPPAQNNTQQNTTQPPPQQNTTQPPSNTTPEQNATSPPPAPYQPSTPPSSGNGSFWPTETQPQKSSIPCCPSAAILLLAGFAAVRKAI